MRTTVLVVALTACATSAELPPETEEMFEFEPGLFIPLNGDLKVDLPNQNFSPRPLDTSGNKAIAKVFVAANFDVVRTDTVAEFDWPLAESRAVLNRSGTPIMLGSAVYEHTGFDIIRLSQMEDATVYAPVTGKATITDWAGAHSSDYDYSTVISIWDPETHLVVQLMHVKPEPGLPRTGFFDVTRGDVIGELANVVNIPDGRHTHVSVVDAEHFELLDPVKSLPYPDVSKPTAVELYLLDDKTKRHNTLTSGVFDVMVTAFDRDDMSGRNLEVTSVAYAVHDQNGNELARLDRCQLRDAFKKLVDDWSTSTTTIRLLDFGNATGQIGGFWPGSDLGNPNRLFRYALTNLRLDNGTCSVVATDRDGQVTIADTVTSVTVDVQLWDARNNRETKRYTIAR